MGWGALSEVVVKNEELKRFQHTVACPRQAESLPRVAASVLSGHCTVMNNCVNHAGMPWEAFFAGRLSTPFPSALCFKL